jgi:hypothetical protein
MEIPRAVEFKSISPSCLGPRGIGVTQAGRAVRIEQSTHAAGLWTETRFKCNRSRSYKPSRAVKWQKIGKKLCCMETGLVRVVARWSSQSIQPLAGRRPGCRARCEVRSRGIRKEDVVTSSRLRQTAKIKRRYQGELEQNKHSRTVFKALQSGRVSRGRSYHRQHVS